MNNSFPGVRMLLPRQEIARMTLDQVVEVLYMMENIVNDLLKFVSGVAAGEEGMRESAVEMIRMVPKFPGNGDG